MIPGAGEDVGQRGTAKSEEARMSATRWLLRGAVTFAAAILAACATVPAGRLESIEHIVIIYAENRSFDHLYGLFPGAEGIADATPAQKTQLDHDGTALPHLPPVYDHG